MDPLEDPFMTLPSLRWTPLEDPPVKTFRLSGEPLRVDAAASHRGRVRIEGVTRQAAGLFRCEVSYAL